MRKRGETERMIYIRGSEIRVTVRKIDRWREGGRETEGGRERK